jgi:hypothetical protein
VLETCRQRLVRLAGSAGLSSEEPLRDLLTRLSKVLGNVGKNGGERPDA